MWSKLILLREFKWTQKETTERRNKNVQIKTGNKNTYMIAMQIPKYLCKY